MAKITSPTIAATLGTKNAAPSSLHPGLRVAFQSIEDQRREGKTDAQEAIATMMAIVEAQRRAGWL